jgi:hypothetical protein
MRRNWERRIEVAVSMMWCQRAGSCQPIGTRDANLSCEGKIANDENESVPKIGGQVE